MGRYSRKDMIEFANFAKSYQSSKKVSEAYAAYLKGARIKSPLGFGTSLFKTIIRADKVFVNGMCVKSRSPNEVVLHDIKNLNFLAIDSWDNELKILHLKMIES